MSGKYPQQRLPSLFGHGGSRELWDMINDMPHEDLRKPLFELMCTLQEFETQCQNLEARVAALEDDKEK